MNHNYIIPQEWSILEEGFQPHRVMASESLFSLGNGHMGQRANFEETYTGETFQGSYMGGVYYPDKTRVGWWKNGYPEYFAKVLNAPNWIGIRVQVNGTELDLNTCTEVAHFKRELNMQEGWYQRSFRATLPNDVAIEVVATRFLSMDLDQMGAISYKLTVLNTDAEVVFQPYLDSGISNRDSNWDDQFWATTNITSQQNRSFIEAHTLKTQFATCTFMMAQVEQQGTLFPTEILHTTDTQVMQQWKGKAQEGESLTLYKYGGYTVDRDHESSQLVSAAQTVLHTAQEMGFATLLQKQKEAWASIWEMGDIAIHGDVKAQQGIRFNIFQLNQTYTGRDSRLNIGPKGFTGEKYGGSTYWDTEAYCLPFYMATKDQQVARNLLEYRYEQLGKAIENAQKLGFKDGAALYPMVTMNGEECHNEWEITFEEIHRNGAIAFAIYNYVRFTGDTSYVPQKGLEVLIGIARFWAQRATFSQAKQAYVILGVTGPNEYENNINNNWYTNYLAQWCLQYAAQQLQQVAQNHPVDHRRILEAIQLKETEAQTWEAIAQQMYFPYWPDRQLYLQQDGFLDKELIPAAELPKGERPLNQHWSWDRILRSPYIKQADTLQGFYFFGDRFSQEELERHYDFYEPFTVHESSLSPCVHSVLAARLGRMEQAYAFYLRTSRLDLDDYNHEVEEGLHITSMAGTWMSIVEGFGGMQVEGNTLHFNPQIPQEWEGYGFKVNFRGHIVKVTVGQGQCTLEQQGPGPITVVVGQNTLILQPGEAETV